MLSSLLAACLLCLSTTLCKLMSVVNLVITMPVVRSSRRRTHYIRCQISCCSGRVPAGCCSVPVCLIILLLHDASCMLDHTCDRAVSTVCLSYVYYLCTKCLAACLQVCACIHSTCACIYTVNLFCPGPIHASMTAASADRQTNLQAHE